MLSADQFAEKLKSLINVGGRQLRIKTDSFPGYQGRWYPLYLVPDAGELPGSFVEVAYSPPNTDWVENLYGVSISDDVEFRVYGFDPDLKVPVDTVQVKEMPVWKWEFPIFKTRLRGKTGKPEAVAQYLANFINKLAAEVESNLATTKPPVASNLKKAIQLIKR